MKISFLVLTAAFSLALSGCLSDKSVDATGGKTAELIMLSPEKVKSGKVVYDQMCSSCHQPDGAGKAGFAPRLNSPDFLGIADDDFIRRTILEGREGTAMMAYKNLPMVAEKADDLVEYIRSWQNSYANFVDYNVDAKLKVSGNSRAGQKGFRTYCASCHGPRGGGYADGGSGPAIGLPGFLRVASDDYIKKTIEIGRAGTAMRPFGHGSGLANISESEIGNIVSFLRSLSN